MLLSDKGMELLESFEGLRLEAYQDEGGRWTIGYGHTPAAPGEVCTQEEAQVWLVEDITFACKVVRTRVIPELKQPAFDALVCFVYNVGIKHFESSALLVWLNHGQASMAAQEFLKWDHVNGKTVPGLLERRTREMNLFLEGMPVVVPGSKVYTNGEPVRST